MKKRKVLLSVLAGFSLAACSHENPLLTQPTEDSASFLKEASTYAEKAIDDDKGWFFIYNPGQIYGACASNRIKDEDICSELYEHMVEYAKKSDSSYRSLTISDLEAKEAYSHVGHDYRQLH